MAATLRNFPHRSYFLLGPFALALNAMQCKSKGLVSSFPVPPEIFRSWDGGAGSDGSGVACFDHVHVVVAALPISVCGRVAVCSWR